MLLNFLLPGVPWGAGESFWPGYCRGKEWPPRRAPWWYGVDWSSIHVDTRRKTYQSYNDFLFFIVLKLFEEREETDQRPVSVGCELRMH